MKKDNRSPKDIIQVFGTMLEERLIPIGFKFFKSTKTLKLTLKGYDLSFSLLSDYRIPHPPSLVNSKSLIFDNFSLTSAK